MQKIARQLLLLPAISLLSCGDGTPKEDKPVVKKSAPPPVYKMDMLEKMFNNDNWMKINGEDTSFYYFSRILSEITVQQFQIVKGDSVVRNVSVIHFSNDSLVWQYNDTITLFLSAVTENKSEWTRKSNPSEGKYVTFEQKNKKDIEVVSADEKPFTLTRTLPLSSFLVRSRYDFLHGTRFAFTDTVFSPPEKK